MESKKEFNNKLFQQHQLKEAVPSNKDITAWAEKIICILYPQFSTCVISSAEAIEKTFDDLQAELIDIMNATTACVDCNNNIVAERFMQQVPYIYNVLNTDIESILKGDPAAHHEFEVIRAYPGFYALAFYRIAHELQKLSVPLVPRILTEMAHSKTGIDIHPSAQIGQYCCIDHGTGIVIGETARIGQHVKLYQGVTLGALSISKEMANTKRHPTVEDHVVIYSGATILGGETIIGHHSVIGGNVWITESVPPGSLVYHNPEVTIIEGKYLDALT